TGAEQRRAVGSISTGRSEADIPEILSGIRNGHTEGTPIAIVIRNTNVHSSDYESIQYLARPGHADYSAEIKYRGYQDASGGGHFSGRLTAPMTVCGAILRKALEDRNIYIGSHIVSLHGIKDDPLNEAELKPQIQLLNSRAFAVLNEGTGKRMMEAINEARLQQDSLGGILETAVIGLEAGVGEPEFDSIESRMAQMLFSIPAVKGVEFGSGFAFAEMKGSEANDSFRMNDGKPVTVTNHNGGINGGISNGMPIVYRTAIKPTPSISQKQNTINFKTMQNAEIEITGRHDPAIIHRARAVVDAMSALILADLLAERYGREWLRGESE
ncbi:MAG: chorismate synthase, partial [Erysipelotrichia bacterium]|nr:chorismate synthase [Erysipelotrichia bacterium]